jgi:hypothetical protein
MCLDAAHSLLVSNVPTTHCVRELRNSSTRPVTSHFRWMSTAKSRVSAAADRLEAVGRANHVKRDRLVR